jgi:LysM repeat protein
MRFLTASVMTLLLAAPLAAQVPQPLGRPLEPTQPPVQEQLQEREQEHEHVVRRGDTLWDLAARYLRNPFQWPRIHQANQHLITNPHWIYPDQVIVIPGIRQRVEVVARPDAGRTYEPQVYQPAEPPARTVFYREPPVRRDGPMVLTEGMAERVPVRPGEFYRAEYLAPERTLPVVARVIRPLRELEQATGLQLSAHPLDDLYVTYVIPEAVAIGDRYLVAAVGSRVQEAGRDTRMIEPRAIVRVVAMEPEMMQVQIEQQFDRVTRGHVLLPLEFYPDFLAAEAEPVAAGHDLTGRVIRFVGGGTLPGLLERAFIDLGAAHGVKVGDIFEAYVEAAPARRRQAETSPTEPAAELRVIRVNETTATVVVDDVMRPVLEPGIRVRRVRKMP